MLLCHRQMSQFIQEEWQSTLSWMWHCDDWHKFVAAKGGWEALHPPCQNVGGCIPPPSFTPLLLFHWNCLYVVPFLRHSSSKNGMTLKLGLGVVQDHWKWSRSIDHTTFYWSTLSAFELLLLSYLTLNNIVTLKSGLEVFHGHSNWYHSKAWVRFPIRLP